MLAKYPNQTSPIMLLPGFKYLIRSTTLPIMPIEIIFSCWECLPTNNKLSEGVKLYYFMPDDEKEEKEYYLTIIKNKYGAQAGELNYKFYKDYDNIID